MIFAKIIKIHDFLIFGNISIPVILAAESWFLSP